MSKPDFLKIGKDETDKEYLIRLYENMEDYEINKYDITDLMNEATNSNFSESKWRKDYAGYKEWYEFFMSQKGALTEEDRRFNDVVEIDNEKEEKIHTDKKLIKMSEEDRKDPEFLLEAHGYDSSKWEILRAKSSRWNANSKEDGVLTLYSSSITVKPVNGGFDYKGLLETIRETPSYKAPKKVKYNLSGDYLLLPLYDMHFGVSDFAYYEEVHSQLMGMLDKEYKEVAIIFGQDMFHNDDFRGRTASGTPIEAVDMVQAWKDVTKFFVPLIEKALEKGSLVNIYYSKGNHSETVEWTYMQYLKALFPQCNYDDSLKERKVLMLGSNMIGMNHGDKKNEKRLPENFATEFPIEWSQATTRTVFVGHLHHETVIDAGGITIRRMPTYNKVDQYHDDRGYTLAHGRFQVHEFDETSQKGIYYLQ